MDLIKLSKEIAYKGRVGRRRDNFCVNYIKHKNNVIEQINNIQNEEVRATNKSITCRKSCDYSSCCMEYIDVTVQECESIVYYLYHNENALRLFMKNYPEWRKRVSDIEDILRTCEKYSFDFLDLRSDIGEASKKYFLQKISCPFLDNNLCSIYEVRPYGCVGYYVTTPLYKCNPDYLGEVPIKRHLPDAEVLDTKFYYRKLERTILLCMAKAVYEILEKGYFYLCTIPGLEEIEKAAISDKKVRGKYKRYLRSE